MLHRTPPRPPRSSVKRNAHFSGYTSPCYSYQTYYPSIIKQIITVPYCTAPHTAFRSGSRPPTYYKKSRHHPELFPPELFLILLYVHLHDIRPMYCGVQMVIFHVIRVEKSTFSSVFVWFMGILLLWCYHSSFSFFLFFISFIAFFTTFFTEFPSYSLNNNFL